MIVSVAVMAGVATAYNPIGQSCDTPGECSCHIIMCSGLYGNLMMYLRLLAGGFGCSQDAGVNGGNAFIYECASTDKFVYVAGCGCPTCCEATTSGAFCT
jgi:hypothetical protein